MKRKTTRSAGRKEVILEVTPEEYAASRAKGLPDELLLKPGLHRGVRGGSPLVGAGLVARDCPEEGPNLHTLG